jgi:hypothetical protein
VLNFLRRLFTPPTRIDAEPKALSGVREDERIEDLYDEFCRTFCIRPGVKLMAHLEAEGVTRLIEWLHPRTPCAVPKSVIRLGVDGTRKGYNVWDQRGISMCYEGNWEQGGLPGPESLDALSVLAQVIGKPIKLYFQETQDGPYKVMEFEP